jgi:hypothetical protein
MARRRKFWWWRKKSLGLDHPMHFEDDIHNTKCCFEVCEIILLQAYLYTYSLLGGVTFEVLPLSSCALRLTMLPLLETFFGTPVVEQLSVPPSHLFLSSVSWNIRTFKADYIFGNSQKLFGAKLWEQSECFSSAAGFWTRNCLRDTWNIVTVENPIVGPKFIHLNVTASVFPHTKLGWLSGLVEWIQSEQYLDIKQTDEHCFHLWFRHASFHGSWGCRLFPLQILSFTFGIILKAKCFISNDNFFNK